MLAWGWTHKECNSRPLRYGAKHNFSPKNRHKVWNLERDYSHSTEYDAGLSNDALLLDKPASKNGELGHHLDLIFAIHTFILDFLVDVKRLESN